MSAQTAGPLAGVRVIEFGQYIAVPGAAQILADQGATVIKLEPPSGEPSRALPGYGLAMFQAYNRGKRMVTIDLKTAAGRAAAEALVLDADVVLSNLRPGAMQAYGLGARELRAARPELICVELTGFGDSDGTVRRPGLDIAAQAESGIMWVTGPAGDEPQRVGFPVVDAASAAVIAQAVTAALVGRGRTGEGAEIRVSLLDVAISLQAPNWMEYALTGVPPRRKGNGQPGAAPAADVIAVADGYVVISAYTPAHWKVLCELIGRPDLVADPRFATSPARVANRAAMHEVLSGTLSGRTKAECVDMLVGAGLVAGSIKTYPEVLADRQAQPHGIFVAAPPATGEGQPDWFVGPPARWDGLRPAIERPRDAGADNHILRDHPQPTPAR
ncbi:CaiB/BaiF CoA transferase family protein [Pseudonocardia nigra]|uniref:CaiB/BaiF CoA transferase family protein n=1 Tax=Pseudonocardia nigra TaxID=1921578 RepID=UPI001C5E0E26|nr:CoA transferase [Pseudonocardia nigra]